MKKSGIHDTGLKVLTDQQIQSLTGCSDRIKSHGGVVSENGYRFIPARFTLALAKFATGLMDPVADTTPPIKPRVNFYPNVTITSIKRTDTLYTLTTSTGSFQTRTVIHATNGWTKGLLPHIPITPIRNHVLSTHPVLPSPSDPSWGKWALNTKQGLEYMSGRGPLDGHRIVLGGFRYAGVGNEVGVWDDGAVDENSVNVMRGYLNENFKRLEETRVDQLWTGIMGVKLTFILFFFSFTLFNSYFLLVDP
jgi:hypothetical protein